MSETEILEQYLQRLLTTRWGSDAEMHRVIRRAAALAHWPPPETGLGDLPDALQTTPAVPR